MPTIQGIDYTFRELSRMSGIHVNTLRTRYEYHPDYTLEQLLDKRKKRGNGNPRNVLVDSESIPLYKWADANGCPRGTAVVRWQKGERDPYALVCPGTKPRKIRKRIHRKVIRLTAEDRAWLKETLFARKGTPMEWEIACELIGLEPEYAEKVRMEMEDGE